MNSELNKKLTNPVLTNKITYYNYIPGISVERNVICGIMDQYLFYALHYLCKNSILIRLTDSIEFESLTENGSLH